MMDTAVVTTADLDRLAERVEKAAAIVQQLREANARLEQDKAALAKQLAETEQKLQGQDVAALVSDLAALKKEQREWHGERREVATRIEALLKKLDRIEA